MLLESKNAIGSLERYYEKYSDMVYRIAFAHTPDEETAADVFQDVFLKLVENIEKLDGEEHVKFWLIRVTINCCKKSYRHTDHVDYDDTLLKDDDDLPDHLKTVSGEALLLKKERVELVRLALLQLTPEEYRVALYLFYYEQLRVNEIAQIMGMTPGATKTKLSRARASLGKILTQWMGKDDYEE